jgi:hypothetical protein
MRTTLRIDDDIFEAAKSIAEAEKRPVGEVLSALARKGLASQNFDMGEDGIPVFLVSDGAPPLTMQMVKEAQEDK